MAHMIEDNRAFFVKTKPWHNQGLVLDHVPTFEEAINLLTQGDVYEKRELATHHNGELVPVKNSMIIMRSDGKEYKTVGNDFELLQPIEGFKPQRGLIESGLVELDTGAMLHDGAIAFLMAKIKDQGIADVVRGDTVKANLLMSMGFDGRMTNTTIDCNERVVCQNTLSIARAEGNRNLNLKFKHTKNIRTKIDNVEQLVKARIEGFKKQVESYQYLATKKMTSQAQALYVGQVFLTVEEFNGAKPISTKKENIVNHVIDLVDSQKGIDLVPAIRGTAWQAYNAVSEYVTHEYGRDLNSRVYAQYFGESAKLNSKALELALSA